MLYYAWFKRVPYSNTIIFGSVCAQIGIVHYTLSESLGDDPCKYKNVIGFYFTRHCIPVILSLSMQILIPTSFFKWLHILHPEMIRIATNNMNGLFKSMLDFKSQTINVYNFTGR